MSGWARASIAFATAAVMTIAGLALTAAPASADTNPAAGVPETVTAVPLPTAQINGVAWTQAVVGNTVWVGGEFTNARPAGAASGVNTSPRANLMAYTLSTGVMTSWNPGANGAIRSIVASPDGSRIYVAGSFTTIAGASRNRVAAFSTATGALLPWNPGANAQVADVAAAGNTVWLVGNFSSVAGGARTRVAAVNATTGALLPFTASVVGGYGIKAIEVSPTGDKVVIAGSFTSTNGSTNPGRGMAALDSVTGASMEWKVNSLIRNAGENAAINALASDGDSVYGTGYDFGGGPEDGFEDVFRASWTDGSLQWLTDCHGDDYGVSVAAGVVYTVSHDHYCGNIGGFPQTSPKWTFHHSLAFAKDYLGNVVQPDPLGYRSFAGQPAGTLLQWYPDWQIGTYTGKGQAGWDVKATDDYTVVGGEFLRVNNVPQEGLVRFGKKSVAPSDGPQLSGSQWTVTPLSLRAGEVRVGWPANTDRDSATLTYELFRQDKGSTPIFATQADSNFWTQPDLKYVDTQVTSGTTYQYRVRATDAQGNSATSAWASITASSTAASPYALGVLDDGAVHYWPLGENSGTLGADWTQNGDLTVTGAARGATGPNLVNANKATTFAGTESSLASTKNAEGARDTLSIEAWFKTTSTSGGKIVGFGSSPNGNSGSYDRHIYMDGNGRVTFGVYPGGVRTLESSSGYNDGQWHQVVGTLGADGMALYIDGARIATRTDTTSGQSYSGFWRIGGDNIGGWPNVGASSYLSGDIADVSIYPAALSRAQVDSHWTKSGRTSTIPAAPTDAYGKAVFDLNPNLYWRLGETSGSTAKDSAPDGTTGTYYGDVTRGVAGALSGVSDTAIRTNPNWDTQTGVSSDKQFINPTTFAVEAWFKTDSTSGGKIVGFGSERTGASGGYDRHIYMSGDGRVKFGTWTGWTNIVESGPGFNDDQWHHVVGQLSSAGQQLYLDGKLVGSIGNTGAQDYAGYWRVGGDNGWEGDQYWRGSVDEVAVYPTVLTATQVREHHDLGVTGVVNTPPTAAFSSIANELSVAFDASTSADPEGPIASYAWDFGDGRSGSGVSPTHSYPHSGTYQVTLTVADGGGVESTITQPVTVVGPNILPTASFTSSSVYLATSFDASGSTDVDGTIASYSWAFGDGQTGTGASVAHSYSGAGSYTVTLTVTDDRGGSATFDRVISVAEAPDAPTDVYGKAVYNLAPTLYWRLNDATGGAADAGPNDNQGTYFGDVTRGVAGALASGNDKAVRLNPNGGDQTGVTSNRSFTNPTTFAVEAWFKTDSTSGGKIVSFGVARTGTSSNHDRSLYLTGDGRVKFGTWTGSMQIVESASGFNDNQWHHAVAQLSGSGMQLFLDGQLVSSNANTGAENYTGYWRVGGDTPWEGDTYWRGSVDEVAIYPATLDPAKVKDHYELGKNGYVNAPPTATFTSVVSDQTVAFDGTASADLDGPLASWAWDFGDGQTGTGATVSHSYATAGTYQVRLTVTDGQGMTDSVTQPVTAVAPNVLPTASFTSVTSGLTLSVDGTGSSDSDGTIATYAWNFGDGATSSSASPTHTYGVAGTYTVTLTVTDDRGGVGTTSKDVSVAPIPNQAPTASFSSQVVDLTVSVDGSSSTDVDGTLASYAWNFGDGAVASGATASHSYTQGGTYTITLTVTDNKGATATKSADVTVAAPPVASVLARDAFGRTTANGWGAADEGGSWTVTGTASRFAVSGGVGSVSLTNSTPQQVSLNAVSSTSTRLTTSFSVDKIANAQYISFIGRQVGSDQYLLRVRIASDGSVILHVMRGGTAIGSGFSVPGLTITPGTPYTAAFEVKGTSPTSLSAKLWKSTDAEPTAWQMTRTDSTAALQSAGSIALSSYVPTSAAAYPVKVAFTAVNAVDPAIALANQAPVAALTAQATGLSVAVDGSASSDSDGTISSYAWSFGDGGQAAGATATHVYGAAGTYTVTLTVTDNKGASSSKSAQVTVAPAPANQTPTAAFTSQVSGLNVSVDGTGSTDADGQIASYAWQFGDGGTASGATASHTYAAAGTYTVSLTVTDNAGAVNVKTADVVVTAPPAGTNVLAQDSFERAGSSGWGTADQGGAWSVSGTASRFSVAGGAGTISVATGQAQNAGLALSASNARISAEWSVDKVAEGQYITFVGRQVGTSQYSLRLRPETGGAVRAYILRDATAVGSSFLIPSLTLVPGEKYMTSFEVTGSGTTTLGAKVWKSTEPEPASWQLTRTDAAAALQAPGSVGVSTWLPSSAAGSSPVLLSLYNFAVTDPTR